MKHFVTETQLLMAISSTRTGVEAAKFLNLPYKAFIYNTHKHGLKFQNQSGKGKPKKRKRISLELILVKNSKYPRASLKKRLISELNWPLQCFICGLTEWMGKPAPIHLDHINGVNDDNRLENLRFLCPNCHAQTDTYCGRNNKLVGWRGLEPLSED